MKYHFENIGLIKEATIELGDLTILTGPNNTGKTYIVYTIYGFLDTNVKYFSLGGAAKKIAQELMLSGHAAMDPREMNFKAIFSAMADHYSKNLYEIFSAREEEFKGAKFSLETGDPIAVLNNIEKIEQRIQELYSKSTLSIRYHRAESPYILFDFDGTKKESRLHHEAIERGVGSLISAMILPKPYICVSERMGIPLFYRDLDIQKLAMMEHIQKSNNEKNRNPVLDLIDIWNKVNTRYALPIKDNIDFVRMIPEIIKGDSPPELAKLNDYIVEMAGGVYRHQPVEGLVFVSKPRSRSKFSLTTNLWSSSVKSLSSLYFYLKHAAAPGQLLIIDEPEAYLTPQNQIILARMLAACVNKGIKVLVTTHSDFLIKEFNNLIMLHNLPEEERAKFMLRKGSPYKPGEMLNPDRVKAYLCQQKGGEKGVVVTPCSMNQYGMEVTSMDEAIDSINKTAHALMELIE
ncbi:MAG: ATP-binding protein [Magnetococcus sp. XQGC-1]